MNTKTHRMRRGLALATVVTALAAPAASAAPMDPQGVNEGYGAGALERGDEPTVASDGFDWGDAGIGAAAMLAIGAIGAGAAVATGHLSSRGSVAQRAH